MYIYTAGIVHSSSAAAYTSKASAGVKQTTLVPYANSCMCLRKGVHVTTLNATLGDSSSASISIRWLIVFFFFHPPFKLFTGFRTSPPVCSMHASRKQNVKTRPRNTKQQPPLAPTKETKYAEKQNVRCFCTVGSTFVHSPPPLALPSHCPDAWCHLLLCTRAASAAKAWWSTAVEPAGRRWQEEGELSFFFPSGQLLPPVGGWLTG